jgi:hypothetical protein
MSTFCGICEESEAMPMLMDILSLSGRTSSGQTKSRQTFTTVRMETTPRMGREIGITTDHRMRTGDAPSISAASSSSLGIESKKRLSRKMLKPLAAAGSQIAHGVLSRFQPKIGRSFTVRYAGSMMTMGGIISVASIRARTTLPSTGRSLDRA